MMRPKPTLLAGALAVLVLLLAFMPRPAAGSESADYWTLCGAQTSRFEQELEVPAHLLRAISRVESGRWQDREGAAVAWPWTVTAEGRGRFLPSKSAAIAEVRSLRARGVSNIDVGCMQVNLHFHPTAFDSLEEAFDPARNVAYAAGFLSRLRIDHRSWTGAIGRYHSSTPVRSNSYRRKVFNAWRDEKRRAYASN